MNSSSFKNVVYKQFVYKRCIRGECNKFPDFFVQAFEIVEDFWKFNMLLLYVLWDDWPIFMISSSATAGIRIHPTDCHSW